MSRPKAERMRTLPVSEARRRLSALVAEAACTCRPVLIAGRSGRAVLVAEERWRAIEETLHLASVPGVRTSVRKGLCTPVRKCCTKPGW